MAGRVQANRRVLAKKVTSFNMYLDQATQIQAIMEATGAEKDAPVLRTLLDEALAARRRRAAGIEEPQQFKPTTAVSETLEVLQTLLLRAVNLGEKSLRIEGLNLGLLQETLAEAHAARRLCWIDFSVPPLREKGISSEAITDRFDGQTEEAKQFAYSVARSLMKGTNADGADGTCSTHPDDGPSGQPVASEIDDNQPLLF
jgi:hypothetical protein